MVIIEKLSDMIDEEISDAEKYIRCAIEHKAEHPALAEVFYKLSEEEMKHMAILHEQVVALIEDYKKKNGPPPEAMQTVYNIIHRRHINHATEVRAMQVTYKSPSGI